MSIRFKALATVEVRALQAGQPDAYGTPAERKQSHGHGVPCRHCLQNVAAGEPYLVLAYRPFPSLQPYAETGPIFLHAQECVRAEDSQALPAVFEESRDYIVRGYDSGDCIIYGTGAVVPTAGIVEHAERLLSRRDVSYLHMRSARNNCYQCRIERD